MDSYDVVIVGGGIAGAVAARYAARSQLKTLFIEKRKVPRPKPCSGIQFGYFPKLLGLPIPRERLCTNILNRVRIQMPSGQVFTAPFKMYNFMRDTFDEWLDIEGTNAGAEFRDNVECKGFTEEADHVTVEIVPRGGELETVETKYLIAADGLYSKIRRCIRPEDFEKKFTGATLNFYLKFESDGDLKPNVLYQFWDYNYCNQMFAWVYKKSDLWVVGTGYSEKIREHAEAFLDYIKQQFHLEGEIVKKEGFSNTINLQGDRQVFLGQNRVLFVGDAAGLVDLSRGVGMDGAALSARRSAMAICKAEQTGRPALPFYEKSMAKMVNKIRKSGSRQVANLHSNEELAGMLRKNFPRLGFGMVIGNLWNKVAGWNHVMLLPP
jgi:flavin-dependent dehydrogenase